jgi:hypothetical protein
MRVFILYIEMYGILNIGLYSFIYFYFSINYWTMYIVIA